jgi:uncharacterized protein YbjT (DUF2867 family)
MSTILIAGATGLIGRACVGQALIDPRITKVVILTRRALDLSHPKIVQWVAPDGQLLTGLRNERVDAVLCCLGTTIATVKGDKQAFIHVDKDLVVGIGHWAKANNVPTFCVVSAIGADEKSRIFYSRVKGEMEGALIDIGIPQLHIFQPSMLMGPRREERMGERVGIALGKVFSPLLFGSMAKYKPMPHDMLAKAMINAALGTPAAAKASFYAYTAIQELAAR